MRIKLKRALCISGGGSKGAFAGGLAKKLYESGHRWNNYYGTSTGALLNTLISLEDFDTLEKVYTNVENKDIFDKPPFNQRGRINVFRGLWRTVMGRTSIGRARNLLDLIKETYTPENNANVLSQQKIVCACVTNYTLGRVECGYNTKENYHDFIKYIFASASVPLAMDLVNIGGMEYLDGGVVEHVPLQQAINDGVDEVDVIILRPNYSETNMVWESKNVPNVIMRTMQLLMKEISEADVIIGKLKNTLNKNIDINLYYVPEDIAGNSLVFDKDVMKAWWKLGYNLDVNKITTNHKVMVESNIHVKEHRVGS